MSYLDHQAKVLSGEAQRELDAERFQIAVDLGRRQDARQELRQTKARTYRGDSGSLLPTICALTPHEVRSYSLSRLCRDLAASSRGIDGPVKMQPSLELEISASIASDVKSTPPHGGCWVPIQLRPTQSGLDSKTNTAGDYLVPTKLSQISDALRQHCRVLQAGAVFMSGLGNYQFVIEDAVMGGNWISENSGVDSSESDPSFRAVSARPHELIASTIVSRQLLSQANESVSSWLASRIALSNALSLDKAALFGSGVAGEPTGICNTAGIGTVSIGQNGGAPGVSNLIAMEAEVGLANGDSPTCGWISNSTMRQQLRSVPELAGGTIPVWRDGKLLGYDAYVSNQVPNNLTKGNNSDCSGIIFGNWQHCVLVEFRGAIELLADVYTRAPQGIVPFTSFAAFDVACLQPSAFSVCLDARNV